MDIYLIHNSDTDTYKVGVSKDAKKRLKALQTGNASKINILKVFKSEYAYKVEGVVHRTWRSKQYRKEDFNYLEGEWFFLTYEDIENFIPLCEQIEANIKIISDPTRYL